MSKGIGKSEEPGDGGTALMVCPRPGCQMPLRAGDRFCRRRDCDFDLGFELPRDFQNIVEAWCSWCFRRTHHGLVEKRLAIPPSFQRDISVCTSCGARTLQCFHCAHRARWGPRWDHWNCAEHNGSIGTFKGLSEGLESLEDWNRLFERKVRNAKRTTQILLGTIGGVVLAVPAALLSAEAVGGAIGATIFKLSGAASTSKGLAVLGGGAIASGGFGIAGGVAAVGALGGALGGVMGGVLANAYIGQIEGFGIERTKGGKGPAVIYLDGFLTQGRTDVSDWERGLTEFFSENPWYYVRWEAKTLSALGNLIGGLSGRKALWVSLTRAAKRASRRAAKSIGPMAKILAAFDLAKNPWHVACFKAQFTGIVLATIVRRVRELEPVILVGHSLGARAIGFALEALAKDGARCVSQVHLLGGAISAEPTKWWADCAGALVAGGRIVNYHTENDSVLKYMYRAGMLFQSEPIGRSEIGAVGTAAIMNKDVSRWVEGHNDYKTKLLKILEVPS